VDEMKEMVLAFSRDETILGRSEVAPHLPITFTPSKPCLSLAGENMMGGGGGGVMMMMGGGGDDENGDNNDEKMEMEEEGGGGGGGDVMIPPSGVQPFLGFVNYIPPLAYSTDHLPSLYSLLSSMWTKVHSHHTSHHTSHHMPLISWMMMIG